MSAITDPELSKKYLDESPPNSVVSISGFMKTDHQVSMILMTVNIIYFIPTTVTTKISASW